ncbi:MAG: alpha/beta fold hydrolase [Pseudolabrys sp.]
MAAELFYVKSGPADAPALLLVHPLGSSHEFWDECAAVWSKRFFVVAPDLRGAGQSPIPQQPQNVNVHVRDLIALRETLGLTKVVPIGCAMGSVIATAYAAMDSGSAAALVLSNTTDRLGEESRQRHESRLKLVAEKGIQALLPTVVDMAFAGLSQDERYWRYLERFGKNDPRGYAALALGMVGTDNAQALSTLTCPTLVVAGAHDILLPPVLSRGVHTRLKDSEFVEMAEAAHFAPYQAPDKFSALVSDFLRRRVEAIGRD